MKRQILTELKKTKTFISGQELSQSLGVSRTAIWKVIHQLKEEGYEIESAPNKGYLLIASPDILSEAEIQADLRTTTFGQGIQVYPTIDSTNQQAKRLALEGASHGTLIVAEEQTSGKGRRGNQWASPPKTGIWMTLLLRPDLPPSKAAMLTLLSGLAVVRTIRHNLELEAYIKWPNDVVLNGKKIGGILTEMSSELDVINYVVVGMGINVNTLDFPEEIQDRATSLSIEANRKIDRAPLVRKILLEMEGLYEPFVKSQDLAFMMNEYEECCINIGREVVVKGVDMALRGTAIGITPQGELKVKDEEGQITRVFSGEVSVRGLNGYV